ncbi:MAG TPA: kelch repeat-containing protein [Acidimicrobiia bacterium]
MIGPGKTEVAGAYWARHDLIAVAGGFVPPGEPTRDVLLFDVETEQWSRGPDLPGPRDHAALAALDGDLYLVGGFTTGLGGATAEVWKLDAADGEWVAVAGMGTPRGALGAVAIDGRLLAVGGVDAAGRDLASTEWYDPASDVWTRGPDLSRTRQHVGVTARGRTAYAIGGRAPNLDSVERLRFRGGRPRGVWDEAPSLGYSRSGHGAAVIDGTVCTAGGEEPAGTIAPIECLRRGGWEHVADLEVPRHGLAVVAVGDELHVVSGGPEPGFAFGVDHEVLVLQR